MRTLLITTVLLLAGAVQCLLAHEEFRILGKVSKITGDVIEVTMQDGKKIPISVGSQTPVTDNEKKRSVSQIKKGQNLVVTGFGDSYDDFGVLKIEIVKSLPKVPTRIPKGGHN